MSNVNQNSEQLAQDSRFAALIKQLPFGAYLLNAESKAGGGWNFRMADTNDHGAYLVHSTAEEIIGLTLQEIMIPERHTLYEERLTEVLTEQTPLNFEETVMLYDKPTRLRQNIIPLPGAVYIQAQDITQAFDAEQQLRSNEQYLSSIITNAPIILYELDMDGVFKLSTGSGLEQVGLKINEAVGQSITDYFDPQSAEMDAFNRALKGETVSTESTLGDGYFASRYSPHYDGNGQITGIIGVSYDITDRRTTEAQLQRAQRMEAVGQLTGGIAHDFNNLLAVILGNLDLLADQDNLAGINRDFVEQALAAAHRGANLTKRLLAFSRQQLLDPHPTDANELIESMLRILTRTLPESIEIEFVPAHDLWLMQVDSAQLDNAILNLCVNARDAMPDGGKLVLSTKNVQIGEDKAEELDVEPGEYICVAVADTGKGIEESMLSLIFEPFFTTKETGEGSGLGLSMVYGFIDQSHGTVVVESSPGVGSHFTLYLPRAKVAKDQASDESPVSPEALQGQGETILVVEDDWDVRQFVKKALSNLNYQVIEAKNGIEALDLLDRGIHAELMFSDIVLPGGLSGIGLAKQALTSHPELKILLTTGYAPDGRNQDATALSRFEVLQKPYRVGDLAKRVRQALG